MRLEKQIQQNLKGDPELINLLAQYEGAPAVFEGWPPSREEPGWDGPQEPHLIVSMTRQDGQERGVYGQLFCRVIHSDTPNEEINHIRARLKTLLNAAVYSAEDGSIFLRWSHERLMDPGMDNEMAGSGRGSQLTFDIYSFPTCATFDSDPVDALKQWTQREFPEVQIEPDIWAPTDEMPGIYWRIAGHRMLERWQTVSWLEMTIKGHIITPGLTGAMLWTRRLAEKLALVQEITLADDSPMFIQNLLVEGKADPLKDGQLNLTVKLGVMDSEEPAEEGEEITQAYINERRLK